MPPGQTILWMALVILLCSTTALAADKKKNDSTDLVHDKQPENTTRIALRGRELCPPACKCYNATCVHVPDPTEPPFLPLMFRLRSEHSDCCAILDQAFQEIYDSNGNELNSTSIMFISEEKIANRCSYYDGVLKPCRSQCPLYGIMCHDTKQFVKELKCIKEKPRENITNDNPHDAFVLEAFTACGQQGSEIVLTSIEKCEISGVLCRAAHKYLECAAKFIQTECGPIAKALYMTQTNIWQDVTKVHGRLRAPVLRENTWTPCFVFDNLTNADPDCLAYTNFRINNTLLGSSSSHNTAYGTLIAVILVVCMLPVEVATTLAQNRPKVSLWITAVLVLVLATGLVLSDDLATKPCKRCEHITFRLEGISDLCCQPFLQSFDIDELFETNVMPTRASIYVDGNEEILLREETLMTRCGFYNETLKDCQKKCPLYGLICTDLQKFLEGLKCYTEKLEDLKFQVEVGNLSKGIDEWENYFEANHLRHNRSKIICEREYNSTQLTAPENVSNIVKCANKLEYWLCVEKNFNETCPGIGAWLGLMNFFNIPRSGLDHVAYDMYYKVPESIEIPCLTYATYLGKHISSPGSRSPWNAAMTLGMVAAAIITGALGHRILMNFR